MRVEEETTQTKRNTEAIVVGITPHVSTPNIRITRRLQDVSRKRKNQRTKSGASPSAEGGVAIGGGAAGSPITDESIASAYSDLCVR